MKFMIDFLLVCMLQIGSTSAAPTSKCSSHAISKPHLFGAKILDISAKSVHNFSTITPELGMTDLAELTGLNFCNVTVTYTHPGRDDTINVQVWLPLKDWNGRFQAAGLTETGTGTGTGTRTVKKEASGS